jgi:hypothetical protein
MVTFRDIECHNFTGYGRMEPGQLDLLRYVSISTTHILDCESAGEARRYLLIYNKSINILTYYATPVGEFGGKLRALTALREAMDRDCSKRNRDSEVSLTEACRR